MNPASRINNVVEHFLSTDPGRPQIEGWHRWLKSGNAQVQDESVMQSIQAVRKEARSLETKLKQLGIPEHLYKTTIDGLSYAFQTAYLHQAWGNVQAKVIAAEVRANLGWMSWALSKFDENDLDADAMTALVQAIADQEALLQNTDLPDGLRELLEGQIEELRIALMLYRINGVQPIVDAVNKHSGEMRNAPADLVTAVASAGPEAEGAVAKSMGLISKAAKVAESGSKIVKFAKEIYELGASGVQLFGQSLLSGPPPGG